MDNDNYSFNKPTVSLFPAYEIRESITKEDDDTNKLEWLNNQSFIESASIRETQCNKESDSLKRKDQPIQVLEKKPLHKNIIKDRNDLPEKDPDSLYSQLSKKVFIEETGLSLERAFRIDKTRDVENFSYDSFYKMHIAKFYKDFFYPLGCSKELLKHSLCLPKLSKKKQLKALQQRYYKKQLLQPITEKLSACVKTNNSIQYDYLPLINKLKDAPKKQYDTYEVNPLGVYDEASASYFAGKAKKALDDEELQNSDDSKMKTQWYNERLRMDPGNEELWLEFVDYQEELVKIDPYAFQKKVDTVHLMPLLERKLSILDKAVSSNPRSISLALNRLEVFNQLHDWSKGFSEWKKLIFLHPGNVVVWQHYVRFLQSNLTSFKFSTVMKGFNKAIETLNNILSGTFHTLSASKDIEEKILELFHEMCIFIWQSGFTERAVATFQALVEFNLFTPQLPGNCSRKDLITFFEPFWDSGVPRVGEEGAQGWDQVMAKKEVTRCQSMGFPDLNVIEDEIIARNLEKNEAWHHFETTREKIHWLPWRPNPTNPEEECEDPERMVVVDDLTPFLFQLNSEKAKMSLVVHFLDFLGVPSHKESFVKKVIAGRVVNHEQNFTPKFRQNFSIFQTYDFKELVQPDSVFEFIQRVFQQVSPKVAKVFRSELDRLNAQFQNMKSSRLSHIETKALKKFVRNILKEDTNRNDLVLWLEYLRLEWRTKNYKEGIKMMNTILGSRVESKSLETDLLILVLEVVKELRIEERDWGFDCKKKILCFLAQLGAKEKSEEDNLPVPFVLKAKRGFEIHISSALSDYSIEKETGPLPSRLAALTACQALFTFYLKGGKTGLQEFTATLNGELCAEQDACFSLNDKKYLLQHQIEHLWSQNVPMTVMRPSLEKGLMVDPLNLVYLEMLINLDGASYLSTRLRRFFHSLLNDPNTKNEPILWICAIISEWRRLPLKETEIDESVMLPTIGISWKVRSLFERALSLSAINRLPVIWRMYLKFEMEQGNVDRAKAIYYRSLQKCPGHKCLYMESSIYFPSSVQENCDLLLEKELRLRTPLEEVELLLENREKGGNWM